MLDLSRADFTFVFEFGRVRDAVMRVDILHAGNVNSVPCEWKGDTGHGSITVPIRLPTTLTFVTSGKGPMDTIVDDQGNIIQDCYARITEAYLDGFKFNDLFLQKRITLLRDNGDAITSNYFGFNGQAVLDLPKDSVFTQYCLLNHWTETDK
jgi:hypothetical protein